jgi:hypothetical protein
MAFCENNLRFSIFLYATGGSIISQAISTLYKEYDARKLKKM